MLASPRRYRAATAEFLQVKSLITADIFMREIRRDESQASGPAQLTCPDTDTDHSDQSVPVFVVPLFLEADQIVLPRPQFGDQPVAVLNRAVVTRSPSRTTL